MRSLLEDTVSTPVNGFFKSGCNGSPCFPYALASLYSLTGLVTLIQLGRIHFMMHINRWTMQKGFQTLNVVICIFRAASLFAYNELHDSPERGATVVVIDFTSLMFLSAYTLLIFFWADIVHVAMDYRGACSPVTSFLTANLAGYVSAALFWSLCAYHETLTAGRRASAILIAVLDVVAAVASACYGYKLLKLLKLSPARTAILDNKIREVTVVTVVSVISFVWKAVIEILSTVLEQGLTYSENALLDVMFYAFTEILAMGSVLTLLSRTPKVSSGRADVCAVPSEGPSSRFYDPYQQNYLETPMIPHHALNL